MERFVNAQVGDLMDSFGLTLEDLTILDKPVGQLSSFSFQVGDEDHSHWVRIYLRIVPDLYSPRCTWDLAALRAARIYAISEGADLLCMHPSRTFKSEQL